MEETVRQAALGDEQAFEELVKHHQPFVQRLVWRMTFDTQETQDIVQEVFLRTWVHLPSLREPARFKAWLTRLAANVAIESLRKQRNISTQTPGVAALAPSAESEAVSREESSFIRMAMHALSPPYRAVLALHLDELSYAEIGEVLALKTRTVETRLRRARKALARELSRYEGGEQREDGDSRSDPA